MNHSKSILLAAFLFCLLLMPTVQAKTLLYVPADDRPVSLEYVADTVKAAKLDIMTPPTADLASRNRGGDSYQLWQWVLDNCKQADAIILSADTMIYGGLVDSRTHHLFNYELKARMDNFRKLKELNPTARIYVFSTIMRTPKMSAGGVEPPYYETYGENIFQLTALQDKEEVQGLTGEEQKRLKEVRELIPRDDLNDWLDRRSKNFRMNTELIDMTRNNIFSYLIIGRDDTAPFSQSHKEGRALTKSASDLPASKFGTFPGADQLGMVLVTRAINDLETRIPIVEVHYALGSGSDTIPTYEDQPVGKTIIAHIVAAGGIVMLSPQRPDLVLVVNTPVNGVTLEADSFSNLPISTPGMHRFADEIQSYLNTGKKIAIADIAFGNGADNSLLHELAGRHLLEKFSSYSGWNTASNTIGYAVGQGMLARDMSDQKRRNLLAVRYLDDWSYQANIRSQVDSEVLYPQGGSLVYLNQLTPLLTAETEKRIRSFTKANIDWLSPERIHVSFPWNRMFEVRIAVDPQP
ncbi:MAG: DUF4127 family protein [Veillonellales bacterium]